VFNIKSYLFKQLKRFKTSKAHIVFTSRSFPGNDKKSLFKDQINFSRKTDGPTMFLHISLSDIVPILIQYLIGRRSLHDFLSENEDIETTGYVEKAGDEAGKAIEGLGK
jgi:hypothetical protein